MNDIDQLMFRKATMRDVAQIWDIFQEAISKRRKEGSDQWQDGYPNQDVIKHDIELSQGYVLSDPGDNIQGYVAVILFDGEPAYDHIRDGAWLTNDIPYSVVHRVAVTQSGKYKGLGTRLIREAEELSLQNNIHSMKMDTNFDNDAMLYLLKKLGYTYCGEVVLRENAVRKAFEKVLSNI